MSIRFLSCLLFLVLLPAIMFAQSDRGMITGTVSDAVGAMVPGAHVTATNLSTNVHYRGTTTDSGEYAILSLPVGPYKLAVESEGFKTAVQENVRVTAGATVRIEVKLEVGTVQQSIEVSAQSTQLATDNAKAQNAMSNKLIEGLPTVVMGTLRSPFTLASMTAGVNGGAGSATEIYGSDLRIGGGQQASWAVLLDGTSANTNRGGSTLWAAVNTPSLDAITEFTIDTNGFKAEFGRAGGGMISFVSKSGTNEYHGTAYDFVRNTAFDARGFFNRSVPTYKQNDFGGTVGGPVRIPKLYNGKDKAFFFVSYEGFRNRVGAVTSPVALPPTEFYKGDLHNAVASTKSADGRNIPYTVYDPATTVYDPVGKSYNRQPFAGNMIPQSRFDPMSKRILNIAEQTLSSGLRTDLAPGTWEYWQQNYYQSGSSINPNDKFSIKGDYLLTDGNRLSGYFGYSNKHTAPGPDGFVGIPGILNSTNTTADKSFVWRGSLDSTLTPRLQNRVYFGVNRFHDENYPLAYGKQGDLCLQNVGECNTLPTISTGNFAQWGGVGFNGSDNPVLTINDDITWTHGKHIFKAGAMYEYSSYAGGGQQSISGNVGFGSGYTALPNTDYTGLGFASFLLGYASSASTMSNRWIDMQWPYHAYFFQDDWRVAPRLTLNLGLRYEYNSPPRIGEDHCSSFDSTMPNPGADGRLGALVFCGYGDGRIGSHHIAPGWYKGFGPRLGFSWNPQNKTVIRGGAGTSYAPLVTANGTAHWAGFVNSPSWSDQTGGITPVILLSQGMPEWTRPPFIDPTFSNNQGTDTYNGTDSSRLPEMWNWNLNIQREIKGDILIEAGYSGMAGTHLVSSMLNLNQPNINTLPVSIFTQAGRNLLNTAFNNSNQVLQQAGFTKPYANFPGNYSLAQSLRPYPQYTGITTGSAGADHSGHSSYHALTIKATRRYGANFVLDASYVLSKMLTDSDTSWGNGSAAMDQFNRRLDKALASSDRTHQVKVNYVYELPIGPGKHWVTKGIQSAVLGGWRIGAVQEYSSGVPMGFSGAYGFPLVGNRPTITTYEGWRAPTKGDSFDPGADRYFQTNTMANWPTTGGLTGDTPVIIQEGWFPVQPRDRLGNMTRNNPKMRNFPLYNENISLAKTFTFTERRRELDLRFEAYNVFNRTQFGTPNTNLGDANFGMVTSQANTPRTMQFAAKFIW